METVFDESASGSRYLRSTGSSGQVDSPSSNQLMQYDFELPVSDTFFVWVRVLSPTSAVDSFWVGMDGAAEEIYDTAECVWPAGWAWTRVSQRALDGAGNPIPTTSRSGGYCIKTDPREFRLVAGQHRLFLRKRDPGTAADRILITNDPAFVPSGIGEAD